ncbi:MAG: hypothetical protein LBH43_04980 [Treponema sp.]|jgi:hypothetical protein|nr:hypothetical protein [Treponema sp.]
MLVNSARMGISPLLWRFSALFPLGWIAAIGKKTAGKNGGYKLSRNLTITRRNNMKKFIQFTVFIALRQ